MKHVVLNDTGSQSEFKPDVMFDRYLSMTEKEVKKIFQKKNLKKTSCPACTHAKSSPVFKKSGFQYVECTRCRSVYMSPRPGDEQIKKYYLNSSAIAFWHSKLAKNTQDTRKEKIYEPRLRWIKTRTEEYMPEAESLADVNTRDNRFIRELIESDYFSDNILLNPFCKTTDIAGNLSPKARIIDSFKKPAVNERPIDVIAAFEAIDIVSDVDMLMKKINAQLTAHGLVFLTTISISGFDLQVLWEDSRSIFPPDRINVLSQKGLEMLFARNGFEIIEYSTPGILDLDMVKSAMKKSKNISIPRFVKTMLELGHEHLIHDFQEFLQINRLSSFVRAVLRKK
ncbi:MAG: methyltransferase domain-containing protein [bacterium]